MEAALIPLYSRLQLSGPKPSETHRRVARRQRDAAHVTCQREAGDKRWTHLLQQSEASGGRAEGTRRRRGGDAEDAPIIKSTRGFFFFFFSRLETLHINDS